MRFWIFIVLVFGFVNISRAQNKYVAPEKNLHLTFYSGVSFLKYDKQPGLFELSFPYSRLDTATGGQIPQVFNYSKNNLPGNHSFTLPVFGMEIKHKNCFFRADIRFPQRRRISEEHFSLGYEWRMKISETEHNISLFGAFNEKVPRWISSLFVRGEVGINIYKPVWLLDEIPVVDTSIFMMGYTIKKSDSDVRSLGIYYEEDVVALTPSLTIGLGTNVNKIDFALIFAPFIPINETGGIRLLYKKNNTGWVVPYTWFWYPFKSVVEPGQHNLQEKYNGEIVSKTPFHITGFEIFLRVGIRIR